MTLVLNGTTGVSAVDGSASTPAIQGNDTNTGVFFPAADTVAVATGGSERVRVDSSGNVGVGTSSPSHLVHAAGNVNGSVTVASNNTNAGTSAFSRFLALGDAGNAQFGMTSSGYTDITGAQDAMLLNANSASGGIAFALDGVLKAKIDSSGNLLVGTTSQPSSTTRLVVKGASTGSGDYGLWVQNSAGTETFKVRNDGIVVGLGVYSTTTGSAANMFVATDGVFYRSTSSLKYKRDVEDSTRGLADVMALRPVTYKGKSEGDGDKVFGGLIAEEVHEAGLTEFVQYAEDGSPDALAYGNMVSLCIKAIQELNAKVESLTAEIATLKGAQA